MKNNRLNIVILSSALIFGIFSESATGQTDIEMIERAEILEAEMTKENDDTLKVGNSKSDTTSIEFGKRHILIIEKNGKTDISISERDNGRSDRSYSRPRPFKGNWRGLEIGLNNYVNGDYSTSLAPGEDFMELRATRSRNFNLNILQYDLGLFGNNVGLVTGLGFEFNNYWFSNNVSIIKENRVIVPVHYDGPGVNLDKSRLRAVYLNVPLLLEFQTNNQRRSHRAYVSAGVIGSVNIASSTKVVYRDNSGRSRDRIRDDFYLSPFRYGLTVRTGYRALNLYANFYPVQLFQEGKGPELYPFAVGFSLLGF